MQKKIRAARELGTKIEVLTTERAKQLTPFLEFDELAGIAFDPDAIRVRAGDAVRPSPRSLKRMACNFASTRGYGTPPRRRQDSWCPIGRRRDSFAAQ